MQTTWDPFWRLRKAILTSEARFNADSQINTGHFSFGRQNFSLYETTLRLSTFKFFNSIHSVFPPKAIMMMAVIIIICHHSSSILQAARSPVNCTAMFSPNLHRSSSSKSQIKSHFWDFYLVWIKGRKKPWAALESPFCRETVKGSFKLTVHELP